MCFECPAIRNLLAATALLMAATGILRSEPLYSSEQSIESAAAGYAPQADPLAPITVGPRDAVGKKSAGSKIVAGLLGGSPRGTSKQSPTRRDPTRKLDFITFEDPDAGLEIAARAEWSDDGLLVSTRIVDADDKGTFQTVFLQTCDGRRLYPQRYEIFDLWSQGALSVSWSQTSSVNGQVVDHGSGGWNDRWSTGFDSFSKDLAANLPATWQQLGFSRAEGGVRQLGSYFKFPSDALAKLGAVSLFSHTTQPGEDPVTTVASYWLIVPGASGAPQIVSPDQAMAGTAETAWQDWAERCEVVSPLLLAAAGNGAALLAQDFNKAGPGAHSGYPLPAGVTVGRATGTGRTTGHIANITVSNGGSAPVTFPDMPFYIPSDGKYQDYVGAPGGGTTIPPGDSVVVPVSAYCANVRRPPVPAGEALPPIEQWVVPGDPSTPIAVPPRAGAGSPGTALIPGTSNPVPRAVDPGLEPLIAAPLLFGAIAAIKRTTADLQARGELHTPFGANPDRERESVVQQTLWLFAAQLAGAPYTEEEFTARMEAQYESNTGVPISAAPPEEQQRVQQGAGDFWDAFELVGVEAKVISHAQDADAAPISETDMQQNTGPGQAGAKVSGADESVAKEETEEEEPACGGIKGKVSTNPDRVLKSLSHIVVYVTGNCDFCPPERAYDPTVVKEDMSGIHPSFLVVPKDTPITLVNAHDKDIDSALTFIPSPVDGLPEHDLPSFSKGESKVVTPTKTPSGNWSDDYMLHSRYNKRHDAKVFVSPNRCYSIADEDGNYAIGELPPATYHLKVYTHPKRTNFQEGDVVVEERKVTIKDFLLDRVSKKKDAQ